MAKTPETSAMRVKPVMRRATPEDAGQNRHTRGVYPIPSSGETCPALARGATLGHLA